MNFFFISCSSASCSKNEERLVGNHRLVQPRKVWEFWAYIGVALLSYDISSFLNLRASWRVISVARWFITTPSLIALMSVRGWAMRPIFGWCHVGSYDPIGH